LDLNRLYFDHQLSLIKAQEAVTSAQRRDHESDAASIAGRIAHRQGLLGASAARAWEQPA
jgi:hypothetical protein